MTNSRTKGHAYERALARELREFFPECRTSRDESHFLDRLGVDFTNTGHFHIQAKAVESLGSRHLILKSMPDNKLRLLFHKVNHHGTVVSMLKDDFYLLLKRYLDV
jgi:hypothetical protein